jgi:hypothetical protein
MIRRYLVQSPMKLARICVAVNLTSLAVRGDNGTGFLIR